jgi:DNA adenine methylase
VFFAKDKSEVEVLNDTNRMVINFYEQAKTNFEALQQAIKATPMSRAAHEDAIVIYNHPHLFTSLQAA